MIQGSLTSPWLQKMSPAPIEAASTRTIRVLPVPRGLVKSCFILEESWSPPAVKLPRSISRPERNIRKAKPRGARMPSIGWSSGTIPRPLVPTIMPATNSPTTMGINKPLSLDSSIGTRNASAITTMSGIKLVSTWAI